MKVLLNPLAAALAVALTFPAVAEQVLTVDTVVVSGSRSAEDLLYEASSISVIKPDEQIVADNIPDLIKDIGSVNLVSDGTPGAKRVSIRGENASRTLLLVDGQRIDDSKTKSGAPMLINPFFIDHIEILKGPSSVLYGSDAMGGIVHVITKQASEKPFSAEGGVAYVGSGNGFSEYVNVSGTLNKFSYALGGFNTDMGDMYLASHERVGNTSYYSKGLNAHLSYMPTESSTISFVSEYFDLNAFTATTTDDPGYHDFNAHIPKWRRVKNTLSLELNDINEYLAKVSLSGYLQQNDKDFYSRMQSRSLQAGVENTQDTYGGNVQFEFALSDMFYLTTGYDGRVDELSSDSSASLPIEGHMMSMSYSDDDYKQTTHALYALLETYLTDTLTLDTGVRWNYVETKPGSTSFTSLPAFLQADRGSGSFTNSRVVGSAGLVWQATDNGAVRFNWSQGFRVPNIQELYLTTFTGEIQQGNPNLEPETSNNYELGFRYVGNMLTADVALFYTKAKNYIETYSLDRPGPLVYSYHNISNAESYGAEVSLSYSMEHLMPYLDFTLMERKYDTGTQSSTNTGTPKFKGRAGLRYTDTYVNMPYFADVYARFATRSKNDNLDGASYFDNTDFAGYMTLNLQVGLTVGEEQQWHLYAGVENILDKDYQTTELIEEPGRFFNVGVSATF